MIDIRQLVYDAVAPTLGGVDPLDLQRIAATPYTSDVDMYCSWIAQYMLKHSCTLEDGVYALCHRWNGLFSWVHTRPIERVPFDPSGMYNHGKF